MMCSNCSMGACWASWCSIIWSIRGTGTQQQLWHRTHWQAPSRCQSRTDRCRYQGVLLLLRYQSDCLLQACHLLSEKSVSLSLPAVPCVLLHSMLWQQLANAELTLRAGG